MEAWKEFEKEKVNGYVPGFYGPDHPNPIENFAKFLDKIKDYANGENIPKDHVPQVDYWLINNEKFIGRVAIRLRLTPALRKLGGHIGYAIRPSARKKGYGTAMLNMALEKAKNIGLKKVLLGCNETNTGSKKIIEKNGGVFDKRYPLDGKMKLSFWIDLEP